MKKKKLSLQELKVTSFITSDAPSVKGGATNCCESFAQCPTLPVNNCQVASYNYCPTVPVETCNANVSQLLNCVVVTIAHPATYTLG